MLIGQTILIPYPGNTNYYGPWMSRQADATTVVCETIRESTSGWGMLVVVETKNAEDTDSSAATLGSLSVTAVGPSKLIVTGCLELIRYRYQVQAEGAAVDVWIHFRTNPPIWQPN